MRYLCLTIFSRKGTTNNLYRQIENACNEKKCAKQELDTFLFYLWSH